MIKMRFENKVIFSIIFVLSILFILSAREIEIKQPENPKINNITEFKIEIKPNNKKIDNLPRFKSGEELVKAFEEARTQGREIFAETLSPRVAKTLAVAEQASVQASSTRDFSETNIQVAGVDEADIIKTDGDYIYTIAKSNLVIVKAYPASDVDTLSTTKLNNFVPNELFIHNNRLLLFGYSNYNFDEPVVRIGEPIRAVPYPRYVGAVSVKLYDISDKENPKLLRTVDFEGNYLTSRKIGPDVYFVVNSYPHYYKENSSCENIIPLYRESKGNNQEFKDFNPISKCTEIGYIEPIQANNFITIASISMSNENKAIEKEVIVGSGQNVYASLENLYIAQTTWSRYNEFGKLTEDSAEKTIITKFALDNGKIKYLGTGEVKGRILNQFSMDEFDNHFRIATTIGEVWDRNKKSSNNVYVLDEALKVVGSLEDLAPGEKIYSVRFMGKKGYVVTFKKIDPLFVIDLSDHEKPSVLGKLKIPGYSDYIHPYDETHLIGIGKDTVEADENLKQQREIDFAWYRGIKMAIFDVSDVEHPIEMYKVVIGDRGTDSPVLRDHKAFLFDKDKSLLVIPITLAEIKGERSSPYQYGEFTFQGAYVYDITLEDGFDLRGRVTHYDDDEAFKKSGYYFGGDSSIKRSLYIENVLYTLSDNRLQLNDLDKLERLKVLDFGN
ncbi:beta-propeller domain-containing protein [Candidatus Woesearchaeota archaeon]|nr:beta-propeller domain-containing protein [Candidatus Woesearchaeota archaeon]